MQHVWNGIVASDFYGNKHASTNLAIADGNDDDGNGDADVDAGTEVDGGDDNANILCNRRKLTASMTLPLSFLWFKYIHRDTYICITYIFCKALPSK